MSKPILRWHKFDRTHPSLTCAILVHALNLERRFRIHIRYKSCHSSLPIIHARLACQIARTALLRKLFKLCEWVQIRTLRKFSIFSPFALSFHNLCHIIFNVQLDVLSKLFHSVFVKFSMTSSRSLYVIIVPLFGQIDLSAFRFNIVEQPKESVMVLIKNVVHVHGLDLVQVEDCFLHVGNNLFFFVHRGSLSIFGFIFVPTTAQKYEHIKFWEFGLDQISSNFEEFENPEENEQNIARCNDNEKEELTFWRQMEIFVYVEIWISWLVWNEENTAIYCNNLCCERQSFNIVQLSSQKWSMLCVCVQENSKQNKENQSLYYNSERCQENCNENADNLAVHDHDFPKEVVPFVAIIQETKLLFYHGRW